jgi:hypothetical protein
MTLDEQLRAGLRRAAEPVRPDEDLALTDVRWRHRRGLLRTRTARLATAVAVVVTLFVGVCVFVSWRATPDRYRSTAIVRVGPPNNANTHSAPSAITTKLADPRTVALAVSTREAALVAAHLSATGIDFRATAANVGLLSPEATAPSPTQSSTVTSQWVSTLIRARTNEARRLLIAQRHALVLQVTRLHNQLHAIDVQLVKLDPIAYHDLLIYDEPNADLRGSIAPGPVPPPAPEPGSVHELNLAFERIQLRSELTNIGTAAASERFGQLPSPALSLLVHQTPATRVDQTPPATVPALAGWAIALVVVLTAALVSYRVRTRQARRPSVQRLS